MEKLRWPSREAAAYWLGAFIDGEGCVTKPIDKHGRTIGVQVTISNTNESLIHRCESALELLEIDYKTGIQRSQNSRWKDRWRIGVTRIESLRKLRTLVPLFSSGKRVRLDIAVARSFATRRPDARTLHRLYWDEQRTQKQIAVQFGTEQSVVARWMARYGIAKRTKSEFVKLWRSKK